MAKVNPDSNKKNWALPLKGKNNTLSEAIINLAFLPVPAQCKTSSGLPCPDQQIQQSILIIYTKKETGAKI